MENNEEGFSPKYKLLEQPLVSINEADKVNQILVKERVHNGNIYNAVVTKYFELKQDMQLDLKLAIETKYIYPLRNCLITRNRENDLIKVKSICK